MRGALFNRADERAERGLIPARAGNMLKNFHTRRLSSAHPRSRGEHVVVLADVVEPVGSSPLARGTRRTHRHDIRKHGLIPAHAGNTRVYSGGSARRLVHPRSRGEHMGGPALGVNIGGSSPLARGTQADEGYCVQVTGLIPARAGNTERGREGREPCPAHPRSRGEHTAQPALSLRDEGSSPLVRGTQEKTLIYPSFL